MKKIFFLMVGILLSFSTSKAYWEYFLEASQKYNVNPYVLYAIAKTESGLRPYAINTNTNGTRDIGIMQINERWIYKLNKDGYPIRIEHLYDPRINIHMGAYVLRLCMNKYGNTWQAIDCYNKGNKATGYSKYVYNVYNNLTKIAKR